MTSTQTYSGPKRGFVLSPHGNIEYMEMGSGPPLILLHQTAISAAEYDGALPLLKDEVRAIAMSTMGFGQSDTPPYPYTTLHEFAQCVIWLMDGLGLEKASVFGTHTGSTIAVEVAAGWPERVDKLIIEECFNWNTPERRAVHERLHRYYPEKPDGSHLIELWEKAGGTREGADLEKVRSRFMDNFRVNHMSHGAEEIYGPTGWEGSATYGMCRYEMWDATPKVKAPTLVIHGTKSQLGRSHEKFLETIPRSKGWRPESNNNFTWYSMGPEGAQQWKKAVLDFLRDPGI